MHSRLSVCFFLCVCMLVCLFVYLFGCLAVCLCVFLSVCLSVCLSAGLFVCPSVCLRKSRLLVHIFRILSFIVLCHALTLLSSMPCSYSVKQSKRVTSSMKTQCLLDSVLQIPSKQVFFGRHFTCFVKRQYTHPIFEKELLFDFFYLT